MGENNQEESWKRFTKTGRVEDYLKFSNQSSESSNDYENSNDYEDSNDSADFQNKTELGAEFYNGTGDADSTQRGSYQSCGIQNGFSVNSGAGRNAPENCSSEEEAFED